ncbi:hypothetical protein [Shewanella sp.]|uniref:hypothetical protein n=1 Tax=Shewanella sp. TaxID=50422 RepID=UPI003A971120
MNKKSLLLVLAMSPIFSACQSTHSDEEAASLNRQDLVADLVKRIDDVGYDEVKIQPGVDEFLNIASSVLQRQRNVIESYHQKGELYVDVQSFLSAQQGKTELELQDAITAFDAGATNEDEKIGHKIAKYRAANDEIYQENIKLTQQIVLQLAQAGLLFSQYGTEVAKATAMNSFTGLFSKDDDQQPSIGKALVKAKDQLSLAKEANDYIDIEQQTIEAIESLQNKLAAKA